MAIQVQDRIRVKLKAGQCPECYLTPCDCANVFFAEPEPEEAPTEGAHTDGDAANGALIVSLLLLVVVGASVVVYEAGKAVLAFWWLLWQ
jgi:NAD-dependent SIR2 family protein deacetylase